MIKKSLTIFASCLAFAVLLAPPAPAQSPAAGPSPAPKVEPKPAAPPPQQQTVDEKAEGILRRAVEALGGASYLNIKSVIGRGNYTPYGQGAPGDIIAFVDYLIYPDRERTDYKGQGVRSIQTNIGADKGWVYDGMTKTISDMKAEQFEDFRTSLRTSVDNLLRGEWRREGASLAYAGRREAGLARRNEAVRVTYPDGFTVDFEFGARDGLPAKVLYKRTIKTEDEKEAVVTEEDRIERYLTFGGVQVPFTIDHYRDGVQSSRIAYDSVEFNPAIPDTLFAKPANPKAIK
ncbi:MAG: hypothetical protein ABR554_07105 [Pyrinomonadaceae bacterium]